MRDEVETLVLLIGDREYLAKAQGVSAANKEMGASSEMMGRSFERTTHRTWLMNQALFTARRLVYGTSLAFIGAGYELVKWGYTFDSQMQQGRIVLGKLMGSSSAATKELTKLFNLTAYTPFQFKDITIAARVLMGFGLTVDQVNRTLANMTDALSTTGKTTPMNLNRISTALGHMMSIGHVTGQIMLQLARDGIPSVYEALNTIPGVVGATSANVGKLNIPANVFLAYLNQFIERSKMHGMARSIAQSSLHGLLTTTRDFLSEIMGNVINAPFHGVQRVIVGINDTLKKMAEAYNQGGLHAMFLAMGISESTMGKAAVAWRMVVNTLKDFWTVFSNVLSALFKSQFIWGALFVALTLIHVVMAALAHTTWLWHTPLSILLGLLILYKTYVLANIAVTRLWTGVMWAGWISIRAINIATAIWIGRNVILAESIRGVWLIMLILRNTIVIGMLISLRLFQGALLLTSIAMDAVAVAAAWMWEMIFGPVGWIITAIIVIGILIWKWKWFRDLIISVGKAVWAYLSQPFIDAYNRVMWLWHLATRFWNWLSGTFGGGGAVHLGSQQHGRAPSPHQLPHAAGGGWTASSGMSWVGEDGPELVHLPRGATIIPNRQATSGSASPVSGSRQPIEIVLKLREQVLERIMVEIDTDRMARA